MESCCQCSNSCDKSADTCCHCKGRLCDNCTESDWKYQISNLPRGSTRYHGCIVIFDSHGVGNTYCITCYNSKQIGK